MEQGLGLVNPNCLDSDFLKGIHLGSLSGKDVADGVLDGAFPSGWWILARSNSL